MDTAERAAVEVAHQNIRDKHPGAQPDGGPAECRSCKEEIYWALTRNGKRAPFDPDGTSHFATCADAARFRKPKN